MKSYSSHHHRRHHPKKHFARLPHFLSLSLLPLFPSLYFLCVFEREPVLKIALRQHLAAFSLVHCRTYIAHTSDTHTHKYIFNIKYKGSSQNHPLSVLYIFLIFSMTRGAFQGLTTKQTYYKRIYALFLSCVVWIYVYASNKMIFASFHFHFYANFFSSAKNKR